MENLKNMLDQAKEVIVYISQPGDNCPLKRIVNTKAISYIALISMVLFVSLSSLACSAKPKEIASALELIQQNKSISVSLNAMSTFVRYGENATVPTEFAVKDVPIKWTGMMFDGGVFEDPEGRITDYVHGTVSADGTWIESMYYSQYIANKSMMGIFFQITLRNIPVADMVNGEFANLGTFEKTGDIQKHVVKVEYNQWGLQYVSTDWKNTKEGQIPTMKLKFDKVIVTRPQKQPPAIMPMR